MGAAAGQWTRAADGRKGTDGRTHGRADARTHKRAHERTHAQATTPIHWPLGETAEGPSNGCSSRAVTRAADGRSDGRMDARTDTRTRGLKDGRTDGRRMHRPLLPLIGPWPTGSRVAKQWVQHVSDTGRGTYAGQYAIAVTTCTCAAIALVQVPARPAASPPACCSASIARGNGKVFSAHANVK